jgi:hypothetical protein
MLLERQGQEVIHVGDNSAGILDQTGGHHCVREELQQIGGTFVLRAKINYAAGGDLTNRLVTRVCNFLGAQIGVYLLVE